MKQKNKKFLAYFYLIFSVLIILSLLFNTIYDHKQIKKYLSHYSDLKEKYEKCMSDNICICVCPTDPNEICTGPITWCGPDKIGQWIILNGKCQWVCCEIIYESYINQK